MRACQIRAPGTEPERPLELPRRPYLRSAVESTESTFNTPPLRETCKIVVEQGGSVILITRVAPSGKKSSTLWLLMVPLVRILSPPALTLAGFEKLKNEVPAASPDT